MTDFLLDTNHLTEMAKPVSPLLPQLLSGLAAGDRFYVCAVALGEAATWAGSGPPSDRRASRFKAVRTRLRFAPLVEADADESARLRSDPRTRGVQLELPDALIAAVALRRGFTLLTADRDFRPIPHLPADDWLAS